MPKKPSNDDSTKRLLIDPSGQREIFEKSYQQEVEEERSREVECLGKSFPNDAARREYYLDRLREHLQDPEFRKTAGFPRGSDEDILRMSDPPYYTACPNPFLGQFIEKYGTKYSSKKKYHRDPFAIDVSVGKTDSLYRAHSYHTKVPHLAIIPSILHYTKPGEIVLDGFAGSGMTGVAAQFCGAASVSYRKQVEQEWATAGHEPPEWGARRAVLNDLGPAATFIAAGYNLPFNMSGFELAAQQLLQDIDDELGWMYETLHSDGSTTGRINFTVWSEVFTCPECSGEVEFFKEALDPESKTIAEVISCPSCSAELRKEQMDLRLESFKDSGTNEIAQRPTRRPVLINYSIGKNTFEKEPDDSDLKRLDQIAGMQIPDALPVTRLPDCQMTRVGRMATTETRAIHHMFLPRPAQSLAALWRQAILHDDVRIRNALLYLVEQAIWGMSILNRYSPSHFSQVNRALSGVFYVASHTSEVSPWYILNGKLGRLKKVFDGFANASASCAISTGTCSRLSLPDHSIDYIFTDPPFGENIYYADLNFLVESWHRVWTNESPEAIVDRARGKSLVEYQELMRACFTEYARVLKPGRWITIVFSNSKNAIWHAIQEALGSSGLVVADVRTLDKQQGSFKQVTSTAVKQDLVISAYKPTDALAKRFELGTSSPDGAWEFVREHLGNVPVAVKQGGSLQVLVERTPQMLLDRMIAFHVQRGIGVPLSSTEFAQGLQERFAERDGMYFLSEQVAEYDRKRSTIEKLEQLELFVSDESSAIQWLRRELKEKPQSFQDLQPQFMRETSGWSKHESPLDLRVLLEQNFICYDGKLEIPSQIHSYLSSNFKELRNKPKDDGSLRSKGKDRWYVPDPSKAGDLEKLRERQLLKEYEEYRNSKAKRLKVFRTEAIRAGFKVAYDTKEYRTIVDVAEKLPDRVLQEDEKLLMYYDVSLMRLGEDGDNTDLF